jgi:hypothetical protein
VSGSRNATAVLVFQQVGGRSRRGVVAPAARWGERHDGAGAAACAEPERDVAAERIADEVRGLESRLVHSALDRVGQRPMPLLPVIGGPEPPR